MKSKLLVLLIGIFSLNLSISQSCLPNGIEFKTQADIDNFASNYPGCTSIEGNLKIKNNSSITNLQGLSQLTTIGGDLSLFDANGIISLNGLDNISTIGGSLNISYCDTINDISALSNLINFDGSMYFRGNGNLQDLNGLQAITTVYGLNVIDSYLTSLTGLNNVTTINNVLQIEGNPNLINLTALDNVTVIGNRVRILYNTELVSLKGLNQVTSVGGRIQINGNQAAEDFEMFMNVTDVMEEVTIYVPPLVNELKIFNAGTTVHSYLYITGSSLNSLITNVDAAETLWISGTGLTTLTGFEDISVLNNLRILGNPQLLNLDGLQNLENIGFLKINDNVSLVSLNALNSLTTVFNEFELKNNLSLENIDGLSSLSTIGNDLTVWGNSNLQNLDGFSSLTSIDGNLNIRYNDNLQNLNGLSSLTSLGGGWLQVDDNAILTSASGLDNINPSTIYSISFENNPNLSVCNVQSVCEFLQTNQSYNLHHIENNAPGCATAIEVANNCGFTLGLADTNLEVITIYPNPAKDRVNLSGVEQAEIIVYDLTGKVIMNYKYIDEAIDISNLDRGIYLITIESNYRKTTKKLIKL